MGRLIWIAGPRYVLHRDLSTLYQITNVPAKVFNHEKWNKALVKWVIGSQQPFMVVDEIEFCEMIGFLKPMLFEKMLHSTQLKAHIIEEFGIAWHHFQEMLKVR
jgi:hypothetical protein